MRPSEILLALFLALTCASAAPAAMDPDGTTAFLSADPQTGDAWARVSGEDAPGPALDDERPDAGYPAPYGLAAFAACRAGVSVATRACSRAVAPPEGIPE